MNTHLGALLSLALALTTLACGMDDDTGKDPGKKSGAQCFDPAFKPKVIYGDDDRVDLYQVTDPAVLKLARATVALMEPPQIQAQLDGSFIVKADIFGTAFNLCPSEPFREQETAAFCSGFLVGPKTVVTAGHCLRFQNDCNNVKFVFDYAIGQKGGGSPKKLLPEQVYSCARIVKAEVQSQGADYSVVELDREVEGREPLVMRVSGSPRAGDPLVVIGHPSGLPTKVAGGATVRRVNESFFVADLDTYGGNSGSAVFNKSSGVVEGILVRGEGDFVLDPAGCRKSNVCAQNGCRGEDVTLIKSVLPFVRASERALAACE